MTAPTLEQLARLRAEAVDDAVRALARARQAREVCAVVCEQARAKHEALRQALAAARAQFAAATTVTAMHWACGASERAAQQCTSARSALLRAEQRLAAADGEVAAHTALVRARELARRAVVRTLARKALAETTRVERRREDDQDDAFRTRTYTP